MNPPKCKVVGLAGGVAAGKSTVAEILQDLGAEVVDADRLGHEVLEDESVRDALRTRWGEQVFNGNGRVDRARLGEIVFADSEARAFLNALVHPRIRGRMREQLEAHLRDESAQLVVLDASLLLEADLREWCDEIVFIEASAEVRERRAHTDRGWAAGEVVRREAAQLPPDAKRDMSDCVITNEADTEETRRQAVALYRRLVDGL